jgi:hypothetical protein
MDVNLNLKKPFGFFARKRHAWPGGLLFQRVAQAVRG